MQEFGQVEGMEIFTVGIYIKEDLGLVSPAFLQLPKQVQLIASGEPLNLFLSKGGKEYRVKYATALDITLNTLPFTSDYNVTSFIQMGRQLCRDHQWNTVANSEVVEVLSDDKVYIFELGLGKIPTELRIYISGLIVCTKQTAAPFKLKRDTYSDTFSVEKYSGQVRKNLL